MRLAVHTIASLRSPARCVHPSLDTLKAPAMPTQRARKTASSPARVERENSNDEIYDKIYVAILEHRLHPGTKLVEERLAEIFDVSRARVREVLARLAHEQIVELIPQRGAYVAKPSAEQARDVFEARRLIEPALLRRLIATYSRRRWRGCAQHLELEADARRRDDKRAIVRLSGEFHTLLADLAGNSALGAQHARAVDADLPGDLSLRRADRDQLPRRRARRRSSMPSRGATRRAPRS